ncbi:Voltage-gated Ion Channel (VIC) Superfamily, partial [Thraustotheca clavata]
CIGVFIIFGIAGRTLFSLKMYGCNDTSVLNRTMCTGFYEASPIANSNVSLLTPRVWVPYRARFDTLASSMIVLMELSSLKWIETAEFAMDIVGLNYQPEENYSMYYVLYFVAFVFLGGFFLIRLFVGVLVEQFQRNNGTQMLTPSQKCWVELERHMLLLKPRYSAPEPQQKYRKKAFRLAKDNRFEQFMSVIIVLNMLFMLLNTAKAPPAAQASYDNIDKLFVAMYTCEFLTKIAAFGGHFFRDSWHLFDAVILLGSYVSYLPGSSIHQISQIGRFFRVLRVMKFAKVSKGVRTVFRTFRASFGSICNVLLLLVLLLYIFAILGRQLFGTIKFGHKINDTMNFKTFGSAILTLFGLMAGGEWHLFMTDCMVDGASCATIGYDSDCGQYYAAWIYFLAFVIAIVYVFLNLFIAVILENFRSCYVKDISPVTLEDFEGYQEVFEKFDKDHKGVIPIHLLARFLHDLPPNLRVSTTGNRIAYLHLRFEIEHVLLVPATPQSIPFFNALLRTICIHHMGIRALSYEQQRDRVKKKFL